MKSSPRQVVVATWAASWYNTRLCEHPSIWKAFEEVLAQSFDALRVPYNALLGKRPCYGWWNEHVKFTNRECGKAALMSNKPMCLCSFIPRLTASANSARNGKCRGRRKHFVAFLQPSHFRDRFEHYNTLWSCMWFELIGTRFPRKNLFSSTRLSSEGGRKWHAMNVSQHVSAVRIAHRPRVPARHPCGQLVQPLVVVITQGTHFKTSNWSWIISCSLWSISIELSSPASWKRFSFVGDLISMYGAVADELEVPHCILQPSPVLHY